MKSRQLTKKIANNISNRLSALALSSLLISFNASALEKILSEKLIDVPLPPNKEIIIKFPQAVTHTEIVEGDSNAPLSQFLRPDGVLLLTAKEAFGRARMVAPMIDGNVVILDLHAEIGALNYETIHLIDPKTIKPKAKPVSTPKPQPPETNPNKPAFLKDGGAMTKNVSRSQRIDYHDMVRFAFRHYSGPARLIGRKVSGKKMAVKRFTTRQFLRVWHQRIALKPLAQWKIEGKYVTVLLANNLSHERIPFDPRALRGRLMFSAALSPVLEPQGSVNDQTLWAVITALPFNQAIR